MTECCAFLQRNQITETSNEFSLIENGNSQTPSKRELIKKKFIIKMCILFSNLVY